MIVVLIGFSHDYQIVYLMIGCDFDQCGVLACPIKRSKFPGQARFPDASVSRPFALQESEKPMTGEGGSRYFTNYINNGQQLYGQLEEGLFSNSYPLDFKGIP